MCVCVCICVCVCVCVCVCKKNEREIKKEMSSAKMLAVLQLLNECLCFCVYRSVIEIYL